MSLPAISNYEKGYLSVFRRMVRRLGYTAVSCRRDPETGIYSCTWFDPMDNKQFIRSYSLDEIRCITRASDIFWRYIK